MGDLCLVEAAINNLEFLCENTKFQSNRYKLVNNQFIANDDDDSYDTIYSLAELEYPVYFTFHQVINHVHTCYSQEIMGYTRTSILSMMNKAVCNLCEHYTNIEETHAQFERVLDDIDYKVEYVTDYYKYGIFMFLPTRVKELLTRVCKNILEFSEDYSMYYHGRNTSQSEDDLDESNESDSNESESNEENDVSDEDGDEECEEEESEGNEEEEPSTEDKGNKED